MSQSSPNVEEIVQQVRALSSRDLARLDAELSGLRRQRMRVLTAAVRERYLSAMESLRAQASSTTAIIERTARHEPVQLPS